MYEIGPLVFTSPKGVKTRFKLSIDIKSIFKSSAALHLESVFRLESSILECRTDFYEFNYKPIYMTGIYGLFGVYK